MRAHYHVAVPTTLKTILRHVVAVLAGYLVFALLAAALFALSHRDPHAAPDARFLVFSIAYGILSAVLAGYVAGAIGRTDPMSHARTVALAIAAVAIVSLLARPAGASIWSQAAAIFLFAPSAIAGGWLRSLKRS